MVTWPPWIHYRVDPGFHVKGANVTSCQFSRQSLKLEKANSIESTNAFQAQRSTLASCSGCTSGVRAPRRRTSCSCWPAPGVSPTACGRRRPVVSTTKPVRSRKYRVILSRKCNLNYQPDLFTLMSW